MPKTLVLNIGENPHLLMPNSQQGGSLDPSYVDKKLLDYVKLADIVNDLIKGTTKLEHDILHNLKAHYCDIKLPKKLALKPSCLCYQELNELLLTGCYSITKFGSNQDEDIF